jgi:hypothetical protein
LQEPFFFWGTFVQGTSPTYVTWPMQPAGSRGHPQRRVHKVQVINAYACLCLLSQRRYPIGRRKNDRRQLLVAQISSSLELIPYPWHCQCANHGIRAAHRKSCVKYLVRSTCLSRAPVGLSGTFAKANASRTLALVTPAASCSTSMYYLQQTPRHG